VLDNRDILSGVCGANDGNLRVIEGSIGGRIAARGNEIRLEGAGDDGVKRFKSVMDNLIALVKEGEIPSPEYVKSLTGPDRPEAEEGSIIHIPHGFGRVYPRSRNQAAYVRGMRNYDISFGIGPAGTGRTYLAVAQALSLVLSKKMRKLVLTRPVVEAGESLGFLPGDLAQKISPYRLIDDLAEKSPPGANGVLFLPYLSGERCPVNDAGATGCFLGLRGQTSKGDLARAVLEGVAFSLRQAYDLMADATGPAKRLILAGGGAVSPLWRQIFADAFALPVVTLEAGDEGSSFGAAILAGLGAGVWASPGEALGQLQVKSETLPMEGHVPVYRERYGVYQKIYPAVRGI
jgi:hypothetical protein